MIRRRDILFASLAALLAHPILAQACSPAPDINGGGPWFNSAPLDLARLRGKVVLVEFWTHGCANCRHVEPYVNRWQQRYADQGLVIVGIHTPEFDYEADPMGVREYLAQHRIVHAVVMDNDHAIWNRWRNRYWPAIYLIDAAGQVCYSHIGEGAYEQTESTIRALLAQKG